MAVTDPDRRGILGHASVLTLTSAPNRTSLVKRGQWVLENLLGTTSPAPAPPGVEVKLDQPPLPGDAPATLRQRMEQHRTNPSCNACHGVIDPIGIALENFDAIGKLARYDGRPACECNHRAVGWHAPPGRRRFAPRTDGQEPAVRGNSGRKAAGLRPRPQGGILRHATIRSIVSRAEPRRYKLRELIKGVALEPRIPATRQAAHQQRPARGPGELNDLPDPQTPAEAHPCCVAWALPWRYRYWMP